jgi:rhamnosyltransferase subunit B
VNALLITLGSAGDVHPFVGIGRALKARGHQVTVATNDYFEPVVREAGLEFAAISPREDYLSMLSHPDIWHPLKGVRVLLKDFFLPLTRPVYDLVSRLNPRETIVVSSFFCFGARVGYERWKFPFVSLHLQPACFTSAYEPAAGMPMPVWLPLWCRKSLLAVLERICIDPMLGPSINSLLAELEMPKARRLLSTWAHSPQKIVGLFPDWFAAPQPDWPPQTELAGFYSYDRNGENRIGRDLLHFLDSGDPPIVFTPGTANQQSAGFFTASIEASYLLGKRALLLTPHRDALPARLPDHVTHCDYLPFSSILPRTAAIVHHGGIGTVAQATAAGIPQLVVPLAYDQPDHAARIERLGIGASLRPAKYRGKYAAHKLEQLLASRQVKDTCVRISDMIDFQRSLDTVCLSIEQVV